MITVEAVIDLAYLSSEYVRAQESRRPAGRSIYTTRSQPAATSA